MATIFKRPKSPFWFACYSDRNGKTVKRTTKSTDRATATRMALDWEKLERASKAGSATMVTFQKVVSEMAEQVTGESIPSPKVREYLRDWLDGVRLTTAPTTLERYSNTVTLFLDAIKAAADQPLRGLTPRHIEQFLNQRLASGVAPKTVIVDVKTINSALRRAENYGLIDKNPVSAVKLPKDVSSERATFTPDDVQKLLTAAPNQDWQTLILLAYYLGARLGDCLALTWDDVDTEGCRINFQQRKTGKRVSVPIQLTLLNHLVRLADSHTTGYLCASLASKTPGGKHGLSESFKRIVKRAGVDLMTVPGKGKRNFCRHSFHALRHSFNSILANAGVPEEVRMQLTGHSSREVHAKYTHLDFEPLRKAISNLPLVQFELPKPSARK